MSTQQSNQEMTLKDWLIGQAVIWIFVAALASIGSAIYVIVDALS